MQHTAITFPNISEDQKNIFIAILYNQGFSGFEEEENSLTAFIASDKWDRMQFDAVADLKNSHHTISTVEEKNWNEQWESDFEPVKIINGAGKPFAFIRAAFHQPDHTYLHDIIITPKMSFGTGHHATTYLMVQQMAQIEFTGKTVIDFGTGTGILSILAEKLGATAITAIDCNDWSISNAKENFNINNCDKIELVKAETIPAGLGANLILANINLNIIIENLPAIKAAALKGATILFSGIMLHDEAQIITKLGEARFNIKRVQKKDNWLSLEV